MFLANAYIDLGTWWCITLFIGAGVGGARNQITGVQDNGIISNGTVGFGYTLNDSAQWNLAWDVQAGLTYNVNDNLKIDFSWRYLNLGSPQTAVVQCQNTASCPGAFYTLRDTSSQDFRLGLRWVFPANGGFGLGVVRAAGVRRRRSRNMCRITTSILTVRRRNMSRRRPSNTCRCSRRYRAAAD